MSIGNPVVISGAPEKPQFSPLVGISVQRDDTHSFKEHLLQELIDATPNILPVREYLPSTTALFSLGREVPVDMGAGQGFIDNLLVTNDGYLAIVETKLYRNPEGIREVIAQTLQYGMAVGQMSVMELEARIQRGQSPALKSTENISQCVSRLAAEQNQSALLADDFEEAMERHLRRGEILLLIVSDGIHVGVERVTNWLNDQGNSSPFKFGLIELKFYTHGIERLVVPRTVIKTREVSRHVVVVDIRPKMDVIATANVTDEFKNTAGGTMQESRSVKSAAPPLTKSQLLLSLADADRPSATKLLDRLEAYPFDLRGTIRNLQIGFNFPPEGSGFHPLVYMGNGGVWVFPLLALRKLMGPDAMVAFHREANRFGQFFRDDQIDDPDSSGCVVKYRQIAESADGFAAFLDAYRTKAIRVLEADGAA
ncbi:MAG: hypothetical protein Q7J42_09020 [Sulfuritalea sp.]|nr:hypothetical protein [Sulfuritalea sp.]